MKRAEEILNLRFGGLPVTGLPRIVDAMHQFAKEMVEKDRIDAAENVQATCNICCSDKEICINAESITNRELPSELL